MNKRIWAFVLTAGMVLSFSGCGGTPASTASMESEQVSILSEETGRQESAVHSSPDSTSTPVNRLYDQFNESYQAFSADLMKKLYQAAQSGELPAEDGVVISPASLYMALGMTAEGMAGDSLHQTLSLLHASDTDTLREGCRELLSLLSGNPRDSYRWANSLWMRDSMYNEILPEFLQANQSYYQAEMVPHAFDDTLIPAINHWVEEKTEGMIKDVLQPPLDSNAFLYLLNTLLFSGEWDSPFDGRQSVDGIFHGRNGDVTLPMMRQTYQGMWMQDDLVSAVLLDYNDGRTSMLIAVPHQDSGGLDALMDSWSADTVSKWLSEMTTQTIALVMPRFSMGYRGELEKILPSMGMKDAFQPDKADFSRLTEIKPVYLGEILHQTVLEVGEKGTKAAAVTAVGVLAGDAMNTRHVKADRPFFCAVVDRPTGALLFTAAVTDPKLLN